MFQEEFSLSLDSMVTVTYFAWLSSALSVYSQYFVYSHYMLGLFVNAHIIIKIYRYEFF